MKVKNSISFNHFFNGKRILYSLYLIVTLLLAFTVYSCEKDSGSSSAKVSKAPPQTVSKNGSVKERGGSLCDPDCLSCMCCGEARIFNPSTGVIGWDVQIKNDCGEFLPETYLGVLSKDCHLPAAYNSGLHLFHVLPGHCYTFYVNAIYDGLDALGDCTQVTDSPTISLGITNLCGSEIQYTNLTVGSSVSVCWDETCCPENGG